MSTTVAQPTSLPSLASLRGRNFFTDQDFTREELVGLLELAVSLKALYRRQRPHGLSSPGAAWR